MSTDEKLTQMQVRLFTGWLRRVDYANGTRLVPGYDLFGRQSSAMFTNAATGAKVAGAAVARSVAGRVVDQDIDTGGPSLVDPTPERPNFAYDGAGRLEWAWDASGREPTTTRPAPARAPPTLAGTPTARVSTGSYCNGQADRLASARGTAAASYNDHRNTLTLTGTTSSTFAWDAADRNSTLTGTTTTYTREPLDRVITRQRSGAAPRDQPLRPHRAPGRRHPSL